MEKYNVKEIIDKKVWEEFNLKNDIQSFLQSWSWGEVNKNTGNAIFRCGIYTKSKLVGICLLIEQRAKRGFHYIIPVGPVIDFNDKELVNYTLNFIKDFATGKGAWFVRLRPGIYDSSDKYELFASFGFKPAPMFLHGENTLILDIEKSNELLLAGMRKNTRHAIRKSLKEGFTFSISKNLSDLKMLMDLQEETAKRHKFVKFNDKIFSEEMKAFLADDQILFCICKKGKEVLAVALIVFYKKTAFYHYSGSTNASRKTNASYFLQWNIIQEAKERGLKYYDFWGIAPTDNPKHRFAGVTTFKMGFGGTKVNWVHALDLPISSFYWVTFLFENVRKAIRHL